MKAVKINFYLEKNLVKNEHRLFVRITFNSVRKKIYSEFLIPEACFLKDEERVIARSNNSKFAHDKRYYSKTIHANAWIEDIRNRTHEVNMRIGSGEEFTAESVFGFIANETVELKFPRENKITLEQFLILGYQEHQRLRKLEGKPLGANTRRNYDYYRRKFTNLFPKDFLIEDLDEKELERTFERMMDLHTLNNTSRRSMLSPVRKMLERAIELKLLPNSYKLPKFPTIKDSDYNLKTLLSISQIEQIKNLKISAKKAREGRDAFLMAYFGCGMRMNEAIGLRMKDFNPQLMNFKYYRKKVKRMSKLTQMSAHFWDVVKNYYDPSLPGETFLLPCMREYSHLGYEQEELEFKINEMRNYFNGVYKGIGAKLKFSNTFSTHSARKSFAVHYYEMYNDIFAVKDFLGHTKIETTIIYLAKNGIQIIQREGESMDFFDKMYEKEKTNPSHRQIIRPIRPTGTDS